MTVVRIGYHGELRDEPEVRAGFIGCGSHAFRNVYPTFQLAPVRLVATCDLDGERAAAFARQFGAERSYADHREMLEREALDAVFVVVGRGPDGRPLYPGLVRDCLEAGCHVWAEKPLAATCAEVDDLRSSAVAADRLVMTGFKKMFFPANVHAARLVADGELGAVTQVVVQYPQPVPPLDDLRRYFEAQEPVESVADFLDHLCHPASTLLLLGGPPSSMHYLCGPNGGATVVFTHPSGAVSTMLLTWGAAVQDGLERTMVVGDRGRHVVVDNGTTVTLHRMPFLGYGDIVDVYASPPAEGTVVWRPEQSLGQLHNKGLVMLGYYGEVTEFASAILEGRPLRRAGLDDAWVLTHLFEAFAHGPGTTIPLMTEPPGL